MLHTLDSCYPHILDRVLEQIPYSSLLELRKTSRALRDSVDRHIVTHVAVYDSARMVLSVLPEGHMRIPRSNWLDLPLLANSVRVIDVCSNDKNHQAASVPFFPQGKVVRGPQEEQSPPSTPTVRSPGCWCNGLCEEGSSFNYYLSLKIKRVQLIRQWHGHRCRQLIKAKRTITFLPSERTLAAAGYKPEASRSAFPGDFSLSPTHIVLFPDINTPALEAHTFPRYAEHIILRFPRPSRDTHSWFGLGPDGRSTIFRLLRILSRPVAEGVTITFVGLEHRPPRPFIQAGVKAYFDAFLSANLQHREGLSEKDADLCAQRQTRVLTEEEYRGAIGEFMFAREAYCEEI